MAASPRRGCLRLRHAEDNYLLTFQHRPAFLLPQITCNGNFGTFLLPSQSVQCFCSKCSAANSASQAAGCGAPAITPTEFERHSGLLTAKKWRNSIRLAEGDGTITIGKWLEQHNILPRPKCNGGPVSSPAPGGSGSLAAVLGPGLGSAHGAWDAGAHCGGAGGMLYHQTSGTDHLGAAVANHLRSTVPPTRYPASEYVTGEDEELEEAGGYAHGEDGEGLYDGDDYEDDDMGQGRGRSRRAGQRAGRMGHLGMAASGGFRSDPIRRTAGARPVGGHGRQHNAAGGMGGQARLPPRHRSHQRPGPSNGASGSRLPSGSGSMQPRMMGMGSGDGSRGLGAHGSNSQDGQDVRRRGIHRGIGNANGNGNSSSEGSPPSDDSKPQGGSGGSGEADGSGTGDGGESMRPSAMDARKNGGWQRPGHVSYAGMRMGNPAPLAAGLHWAVALSWPCGMHTCDLSSNLCRPRFPDPVPCIRDFSFYLSVTVTRRRSAGLPRRTALYARQPRGPGTGAHARFTAGRPPIEDSMATLPQVPEHIVKLCMPGLSTA